ncbi:MAG UNVERIFIED_CONTAM: hypothetical protein LVR18_16725 [Planctomycetaceae bacterium]
MVQAAAQRLERRPINSGDISLLAELAANPSRLTAGDPLIDALLLLTAPPAATTEASAAQSMALNTLASFLRGVGTAAAPLNAIDFQDLEAIPPSPGFPPKVVLSGPNPATQFSAQAPPEPVNPQRIRHSRPLPPIPDSGSDSSRSDSVKPPRDKIARQPRQHGRISVTNSAVASATTSNNSNTNNTTPSAAAAAAGPSASPEALRAILFNTLANDWQRLAAADTDPGANSFPDDEQLKGNIQNTLSARSPINALAPAWAREVPPTFCGPVNLKTTATAFSEGNTRQVFLSAESTGNFEALLASGQPESRQFLINVPKGWRMLSPQPASIEPDADGWLLLPPPSAWTDSTKLPVQLQPTQPLPTNWSFSLPIVAAIDNGRVADLLPVRSLPRPDTQWRLVTGPDPATLVPESSASPYAPVWRLYLPPATTPDKPQPLTFSLQQSAGPTVPSVRVQLLQLTAAALPGTPLPGWEQPLLFNLSPNQPLNLPLQPPQAALPPAAPGSPPAPAAPPAPASPAAISFPYGFCVRVQPVLPTAADPASATPAADPSIAPNRCLSSNCVSPTCSSLSKSPNDHSSTP